MPNISKQLKMIAATAIASVFIASPGVAAPVDTSLWTVSNAGLQYDIGSSNAVTTGGTSVTVSGNSQSTVTSDFSQSGDFIYSGTMRAIAGDNDNMGVTFGFADVANHYRLGWEGGGFGDSPATPGLGSSGANGLFLVVEQGGVGSVLFQNATLNWVLNTDYDFTISRTGNDISFEIMQGVTTLESQTVTDNTFLSGQVGVYTESQSATFANLDHTDLSVVAVPEPGTLLVLGFALAGLGFARRRMR